MLWDRRYGIRSPRPVRPHSPYPLPLTAHAVKDPSGIADGHKRLNAAYALLSMSTSLPSLVRPSISIIELRFHSTREFVSQISPVLANDSMYPHFPRSAFINDLELAEAHHNSRRYRASEMAIQRACAKASESRDLDTWRSLTLLAWLMLRKNNASDRHILARFSSFLFQRCAANFHPCVIQLALVLA